ncbi:MAG: UvrD-helicase domain-containing protein [bacterium]
MLLKKLGKYEIIDWLGGGRFGDVFLAHDTILDKNFALKISRMRKDEITMLKDEARLLASLDHPNIVRFYNIDFIENKFVLVMEFVKGNTLRDIISDEGIGLERTVGIMAQILDAIHYAHTSGVMHRDLKPENILLIEKREKNFVKVTDFGLARFVRTGSLSASTAGTPIYMAPEVWQGKYTEKSDIWSIGVILYEMLTGTPPFLADSLDSLRKKIGKTNYLLPTVLRVQIPQYIEDAIEKCLGLTPQSRPDTKEFLKLIKRKSEAIKVTGGIRLPEKEIKAIKLTSAQEDIIDQVNGNILLLGQAGCGKTTTLTYAIAHLIAKGIPLSKMLACTFTNKAANDIRTRLTHLTDLPLHDLWLGTFHKIGFRILRRDAERLDLNPDFTIQTPRKAFEKMKIRTGKYRINAVMKFIENLKAKGINWNNFKADNDWEKLCKKIYEQYQTYLSDNNILDYDDLIMYAIELLEENTDLKEYYRMLFDYIFVDELQDINQAQYRLVSLLYNGKIFFTGDEDQAIYGWRGADHKLIYHVAQDFANTKTYNLTRSFRLPQTILDVANNLMMRPSTVISNTQPGEIMVYAAKSEKDEANYIVKETKSLKKEGFYFKDIAILYRMNSLSRVYEETLAKARIPHSLISGTSFHERSDIKPIIEYLELLEHYISRKDADKSITEFMAKVYALFNLKKKNTERAKAIFEHHIQEPKISAPSRIIMEITDAVGLTGENTSELITLSKGYKNFELSKFLNEIRLIQELDLADWEKDTLKLMTIHSAKGLEFPAVFLVDLSEDILPLTRKMASPQEIEEERRLCYVALTRAQRKLYLLYPKSRYGHIQQPSRFLVDMLKATS